MKRSLTSLLVLAALAYLAYDYFRTEPATHSGVVTQVRDGDTIEIGDETFRLGGITAPAQANADGQHATTFMKGLVLGKEVSCEPTGDTSREKIIAVCFVEGKDIGEALVLAGLARNCPRHSHGRYEAAEQEAVEKGQNLSLTYELPDYCISQ